MSTTKDDVRRQYVHVVNPVTTTDEDNSLNPSSAPTASSSPSPSSSSSSSSKPPSCGGHHATLAVARKVAAWVAVVTVVVVLAVVALVPDGVCHAWDAPATPLPDLTYLGTTLTDAEKAATPPFIVQMHGDSLMKNPIDLGYPFISRVAEHLPGQAVQLVRYADYAKRMDMVAQMINGSRGDPHRAVIVLSDTDVTNVDWAQVNASTEARYRARYEDAVRGIIHVAHRDGVHLAFSSPGSLLTEAFGVFAPNTPRFSARTKRKQAEYREALQAIAAERGVPFIDLSTPFAADVEPWRLVYRGCVTRDGEHANAHGATIMARLYAQQIQRWMYEDAVAARGAVAGGSGGGGSGGGGGAARVVEEEEDEEEGAEEGEETSSNGGLRATGVRKHTRSKADGTYAGERARTRRHRTAVKAKLKGKI